MFIQIQSTSAIISINGQPNRVWKGTTDKGMEVVVFVSNLSVANAHQQTAIDELSEVNCIDLPHDFNFSTDQLIL